VIRAVLALAAVFGLLHLAGSTDVLSDLTRPLVVGVLQLAGVAAVDQGGHLAVGSLRVPWTRDCAGLNVLAVLWAVALWTSRADPLSLRTGAKLALAVPVAFAANVARILTLIGYRTAFFPEVESAQLHYFIGFLWVLPFLGLWLPRDGGGGKALRLGTLFLAVALALVAPQVGAPGGSLVALCTLLLLAASRLAAPVRPARWAGAAWLAAAFLIAASSMESLWIPWLLLCPWFVEPRLPRSPSGAVLLLGTIPLVAMHPVGRAAIVVAAAWHAWHARREAATAPAGAEAAPGGTTRRRLAEAGLASAVILPLLAPLLAAGHRPRPAAPPGVMARPIDATGYSLRLVGQSPEIELAWFFPGGEGRHHTLPVCLRYRGVALHPTGEDGVMTDGKRYMREFFLLRDELLADYPSYVRRTFAPFASPGVHLIASVPVEAMGARSFAATARTLAGELQGLTATGGGAGTTR
jgi:exosortase/archaeosortase family protein